MSLRLIPTVTTNASGDRSTEIDLSKPGGIDALLEFHRRQFGSFRMDANDKDEDDEDENEDENEDDGTGGDDDPSSDEGKGGEDTKAKEKKVEDEPSEAERLRARMKAADKRAAAAEKALREKNDEGKPELEIAQRRVTELEEKTSAQDSQLRELRIQNAFLMNNTVTWHDPSDAIRELSTMDGVEIDDDGKVIGVKDAIKKLASKKPHWVKKDKGGDSNDDDPSTEASGPKVNGKRRGEANAPNRETLAQQFPALRRKR